MQVCLYCKDECQYGLIAKMDASTVSLKRQVPMRLCCRDVHVPMDASESIIARMNTTIQSMASCFKKKKNKTKQRRRREEQVRPWKRLWKKNETQGPYYAWKGGNWGSWPCYVRIKFEGHADSILLSAPLIDQNENNLWPAHREIVPRFRVATWALKVQRTKKAKRISFTKT